ncbi:MAG: histidinol dehydrogenase, partial [Thiothrix litoralis]
MLNITELNTSASDFWAKLQELLAWESVSDDAVFNTVNGILKDVRKRGDAAVVEYTNRFDRMSVASMAELEIPAARLQEALTKITPEQRSALEQAAARLK